MAALSDDDYRALIEDADLVQQLADHPGWEIVVTWLHERMRPVKLQALEGRFESFDEYQAATGWLRGIHEALDAPEKVASKASTERERRERDRRESRSN